MKLMRRIAIALWVLLPLSCQATFAAQPPAVQEKPASSPERIERLVEQLGDRAMRSASRRKRIWPSWASTPTRRSRRQPRTTTWRSPAGRSISCN